MQIAGGLAGVAVVAWNAREFLEPVVEVRAEGRAAAVYDDDDLFTECVVVFSLSLCV